MNINPPNPPTKNFIKYKYKCPSPWQCTPGPHYAILERAMQRNKGSMNAMEYIVPPLFLPPPLTFNISLCFGKHGRMIIAVFVFCSGIIADLKHCQMALLPSYMLRCRKNRTQKVPKSKNLNMHLTNLFRCIVSLREFCALCDSYIDGYVKSSWRC